MEIWRPIDGFDGYVVSSCGRVGSYKNSHGYITDDRHILKPRTNPNGYLMVVLYDDYRNPHQLSIHRLVAATFIPNDDESLVVDHLDGDKTNNIVSNLEWVTCRENSIRAFDAGLYEPIFEKTRRPIMVTDMRTGEQVYFRGINEAARELGFSPAIISRAANMLCEKVGYYTIEFAGREEKLLFNNYYI